MAPDDLEQLETTETTTETTTAPPGAGSSTISAGSKPKRSHHKKGGGGYPSNLPRGVCRVCGEPADTDKATYCAEHRPLTSDKGPRARNVAADAVADQLAANIQTQLELAAMLWTMRDPVCGQALATSAPQIAEYWGTRARSSPAVARALDQLTSSSGLLAGIAVHAPLLLAVFAHHLAPAIERRRQAANATGPTPGPATQPGPVASPGEYVEPEPSPGRAVIRDGAVWPEGTLIDEATLNARAAAPAPYPNDGRGDVIVDPTVLADLTGLEGSDARYAWEAAEAEAARSAELGIPWGVADGNGAG
jgi:hypothetical protein